ncbi:MAG: 2-C-methyl-D-erythritol 2,4-cyclodiphosphate synthase [Nitrospinota bacterium]|nr:MAG: 2-C-methyl-D-erythritol 2,4-cyclodiphosphate synthase [Nitrospinota bacterium]
MRVGVGYDVHRLVRGRKLILGGVEIPSEEGLEGHSDADVLVHSLCDALLGALALGDIGRHFPDTDPRYAGISSLSLLAQVARKLSEQNYVVWNTDSVIVAQRPRLAPYVEAMRTAIASTLQIAPSRVGIKATTSEGLGFCGRGEGIAAYSVCTVAPR